MEKINIEIRKQVADDFDPRPQCYANDNDEYAELLMFAAYGMLFCDGIDKKPIYFMRNFNQDSYRWAGIINLGDDPLCPQTSLHHIDIAQKEAIVEPYSKISDHPSEFRIASSDPFSEYRFYEGGARWKEADIFDLKVEPFPYAFISHKNSPQKFCFFHQFAILSGTYEGKPVLGMGGYDRSYSPKGKEAQTLQEAMVYIGCVYSCIREDGRKESMYASILDKNGYGVGYYFIEGEEPILTDEVYLEAEWHHLPYASDDPTVVFTDAIWRFGGKEFHFNGKWGAKGYTPTPRLEKIGQSHVYGTWYEGKTPYKQTLYYTWNENMEVTDERIRKMGWKVVD